ncbi:hypothetical protein H696_00296 [Fonticula alba]|uniref:RGS domain-containing protein n=1 Tax=Fonticula alba TaxID=691883 RepID=A0A058ZFL3_FONAL|nr:hypothetical protein H696_00296 [Fonticula alba]KCV72718.1 hypothetical protein H696_00296 [Fonticula alba]|eukprot:XP_009492419.1 hypothetical protein H696_00296 [Fonticula alba]
MSFFDVSPIAAAANPAQPIPVLYPIEIYGIVGLPLLIACYVWFLARSHTEPIMTRGRLLTSLSFWAIIIHQTVLILSSPNFGRDFTCFPAIISGSLFMNTWLLPLIFRGYIAYFNYVHHAGALKDTVMRIHGSSSSDFMSTDDSDDGLLSDTSTGGSGLRARRSGSSIDTNNALANAALTAAGPFDSVSPEVFDAVMRHHSEKASSSEFPPAPAPFEGDAEAAAGASSAAEAQQVVAGRKASRKQADLSRYYRFLRLIALRRNQIIIYCTVNVLYLGIAALMVTFSANGWNDFSSGNGLCAFQVRFFIMIQALIYVAITIHLSFLLRGVNDTFMIQNELTIQMAVSFSLGIVWIIVVFLARQLYPFGPDHVIITLSSVCCLIITVYPLYLSYTPFFKSLTRQRLALRRGASTGGSGSFDSSFDHLPAQATQNEELKAIRGLNQDDMALMNDKENKSTSVRVTDSKITSVGDLLGYEHMLRLRNPKLRNAFAKFCVSSWCGEIPLFHARARRFESRWDKRLLSDRLEDAMEIRKLFLDPNSQYEINISGSVSREILRALDACVAAFDRGKLSSINITSDGVLVYENTRPTGKQSSDSLPGATSSGSAAGPVADMVYLRRDIFLKAEREIVDQLDRMLATWKISPEGQTKIALALNLNPTGDATSAGHEMNVLTPRRSSRSRRKESLSADGDSDATASKSADLAASSASPGATVSSPSPASSPDASVNDSPAVSADKDAALVSTLTGGNDAAVAVSLDFNMEPVSPNSGAASTAASLGVVMAKPSDKEGASDDGSSIRSNASSSASSAASD